MQAIALALLNPARAPRNALTQCTHAFSMRLHDPAFLPTTADRACRFALSCSWLGRNPTRETPELMAAISDHVLVRPQQLERREQRAGER